MLENREISILIWTGVVAVALLWSSRIREPFLDVLKLALGPKLRVVFASMALYIGAMIYLLVRLDVLGGEQIVETIFWIFGPALATVFSYDKAEKEAHYFRRRVLANVSAAVFIETLVNLFSFRLVIELLLVPLITLVVLAALMAGMKPEHAELKRFLDGLTSVIGLIVLGFAGVRVITEFSEVATTETLRDLSVPILLSIGLLPFVYGLAVFARYELAFIHMDQNGDEPTPRSIQRKAKLSLIRAYGLRIRDLPGFAYYWQKKLVAAEGPAERKAVIRDYRADIKERKKADARAAKKEAHYQADLIRYAGNTGEGSDGKPLDRREFRETTKALDFLANCQMGRYHKPGKRYPTDLLERFQDDFSTQGLPAPSGIKLRVSKDGQSWFAWRKTPSGHCFAIGAAGPPPDQWKYDGLTKPKSFPGKDLIWGDRAFVLDAGPNW